MEILSTLKKNSKVEEVQHISSSASVIFVFFVLTVNLEANFSMRKVGAQLVYRPVTATSVSEKE